MYSRERSHFGDMRIGIRVDDADFRRKIDRLKKNLEAIGGRHRVPLEDLITPEFLKEHSKYQSFEELVRASGLLGGEEALTTEKFESIPNDIWDDWIRRVTDFSTWKAMTDSASVAYIKRKVNDGL